MVTDVWGIQEYLGKHKQRGITQKLRKGEQPFLRATTSLPDAHFYKITRSFHKK